MRLPELPLGAPGLSASNLYQFGCRCQSHEAALRAPLRWPSAKLRTRVLRKSSGEVSADWQCAETDISGSAPSVAPSESTQPGLLSACRPKGARGASQQAAGAAVAKPSRKRRHGSSAPGSPSVRVRAHCSTQRPCCCGMQVPCSAEHRVLLPRCVGALLPDLVPEGGPCLPAGSRSRAGASWW